MHNQNKAITETMSSILPPSSLEKSNRQIDENIFEFNNSCSTTDCTGLIPTAPVREGSLESYEELYPFLPPHYGLDSDH